MYLLFIKNTKNDFSHFKGCFDTLDIDQAIKHAEIEGEATKVNSNTVNIRTIFEDVYKVQFRRIDEFDKLDREFQNLIKYKLQ